MRRVSRETLIAEAKYIANALGRTPLKKEYVVYSEYGAAYARLFGTFNKLLLAADLQLNRGHNKKRVCHKLNKQDFLQWGRTFIKEHGTLPTYKETKKMFSISSLSKFFGGYTKFARELSEETLFQEETDKYVKLTKEEMIRAFRKYIERYGDAPTLKEFLRYIHRTSRSFYSVYNSFNDLRLEVGCPIVRKGRKKTVQVCEKKLAPFTYKKYPVLYASSAACLKWSRKRSMVMKSA